MRRPIAILGAFGVVLLVAAGLWLWLAPGQLVKYPDDLDQTALAKGTVTLYADQDTGAPVSEPQAVPLTIERNLKVIQSSGTRAAVQETSTEQLGPAAPRRLLQRFVIDRGTLQNVSSPAAYAYTPENVTDRAPAYSINLPFDTGDGPYAFWKNETATTYPFRRSGDDVERHGLTLMPLHGSLADAPATQAYMQALGLKTRMSVQDLAPQLQAAGIDLDALTAQLLPVLSSADRTAVRAALAAPVEVRYLVSADTRLLVEPTTGAIVSLDRVDQTLSAVPDLSRLASFGTLLSKPQYAKSEVAQATLAALEAMPTRPTRVMSLRYAQTPDSVADIAAYTKDKADSIRLVEVWIPFVLVAVGVALLAAAAATYVHDRNRVRVRVTA